jgi:hypothetical protein
VDWTESVSDWWASLGIGVQIGLGTFVITALGVIWQIKARSDTSHARLPDDSSGPSPLPSDERLKRYVGTMQTALANYAADTDWSSDHFTPLQVDVEDAAGSRRGKTDLRTAFKRYRRKDELRFWSLPLRRGRGKVRHQVCRLTGDPGSGKSVALRHLCQNLLHEWRPRSPVPLYVNLREWHPPTRWIQAGPTPAEVRDDFRDFILRYAKEEFGLEDFVDRYLNALLDHGRVLLVLDAFDEIGSVLGVDDRSQLIDNLSEALFSFLQNPCRGRGILASRPFRSPTAKFHDDIHLRILPMSDEKVKEFIRNRTPTNADAIVDHLFLKHSDLVPIVRNPFFAMLLVEFVGRHLGHQSGIKLPPQKAALYADFLISRFTQVIADPRFQDLSIERLEAVCRAAGHYMLENAALDVPKEVFLREFCVSPDEMEALGQTGARLIRIRIGKKPLVSFVHRKFAEYFAAQILAQQEYFPTDEIPTDGRRRDTLTLLCEIVDASKARAIANDCWAMLSDGYLAGKIAHRTADIHVFRFLIDAFGTRRDACQDFADEIGVLILKRIGNKQPNDVCSEDILPAKFMVEMAGVLNPSNLGDILAAVLAWDDDWFNRTAFWSCRYLGNPHPDIDRLLGSKMYSLPTFYFITRGKKLTDSLEASNAMRNLLTLNSRLRIEDSLLLACAGAAVGYLFFQLARGTDLAGMVLAMAPGYVLLTLGRAAIMTLTAKRSVPSLGSQLERKRLDLLSHRRAITSFLFVVFLIACFLLFLPPLGFFLILHSLGLGHDAATAAASYYGGSIRPAGIVGLLFFPFLLFSMFRARYLPKTRPDIARSEPKPSQRERTSPRKRPARVKRKWRLVDLKQAMGRAAGFLRTGLAVVAGVAMLLGIAYLLVRGVSMLMSWIDLGWPTPPKDIPLADLDIPWGVLAGLVGFALGAAWLIGMGQGLAHFFRSTITPWSKDQRRLRALTVPSTVSFGWIESELEALHTKPSKLRFLMKLNERVVSVGSGKDDDWTAGKPPDAGSFNANVLLAQMEERWRSLAR